MDKSIFHLINILLRKVDCVDAYQGGNTKPSSAIEHIASGIVFSLICYLIGLPLLVLPIWIYYALIKELIIDHKKNAGKPFKFTLAQILERTAGFLVTLPFCLF